MTFSYDGTNFNGYQKQDGYRTIEEELENALFSINNHQETSVVSSGRTDKGVHALGQYAHFDMDIDIDSEMNAYPCSFDNQEGKYKVSLRNKKIIDIWNSPILILKLDKMFKI